MRVMNEECLLLFRQLMKLCDYDYMLFDEATRSVSTDSDGFIDLEELLETIVFLKCRKDMVENHCE
jgi:hypothetical protein